MTVKDVNNKIALEVGVKAFLYQTPGKFLVLKRSFPYQGQKICKWDVPGGRIVPGEPLLKALKREIKEETGLKIGKVDKILAVQDILRVQGKHIVRITFLAKCMSCKVKIDPREHQSYQWLGVGELRKLRCDKYLTPLLREMTLMKLPQA